jgi:putative flippase GtrA
MLKGYFISYIENAIILQMSFLFKFVKFCAVGFSGLLIDYGITYILKEKFKVQKYFANACGFITAASSNYVLNRIWTFQSDSPEILFEYGSFFVISIIGLGINTFILWVVITKYKINFYLAKFIAILVTTLWNFFANYLYTFA